MLKDAYKFPNGGYDVVIIRKEKVVKTIYDNIIDREVALALVEKLELDCSNFIKEGKWASIPFMGSIRVPKTKQLLKSKEQQELIRDAYDNLDSNRYIMFRKQLNAHNEQKVRFEKSYNYLAAIMINRYIKFYKHLCKKYNERFAKIILYTTHCWNIVNSEDIEL